MQWRNGRAIQYISLLLSQQKFSEALGESSLMTEKDSSAIVLHLQAQSFEGMGELLPAAGCYYNIQAKYPDDYLAASKLGALNISGSYFDEAIEATEKYRQIDSTNISVNRQNALAYCLKQDYPTAIRRYEYLVSQGDSSFHTCYYLGISYYAAEKYYEAHDFLEVARKYDPNNINLLYYLGRACSKTSWKKEGVDYLEKTIDLSIPKDSSMTRLYIGMTDCYKMAQMYKEQIASIKERYQRYDKQNHKLLYDMAYIYFYDLKDKKNAERCLEAFLKTYILIKSGIERLTIGKTYHRTDFLHILVGIPLVLQQMHSFFHTIFVQKTGIIHSETRIDYSRQVTGIGFQLFGQIFGRIVTISVLFLHNNDIKDLVIQFVSQLWTDQCAISRIFFFFLTQIIGAFFRSLFLRFVF